MLVDLARDKSLSVARELILYLGNRVLFYGYSVVVFTAERENKLELLYEGVFKRNEM